MKNPAKHTIKNITLGDKLILSDQKLAPSYIPLLSVKKAGSVPITSRVKKLFRNLRVLKRLSPFLIICLILPVLFIYGFIKEEGMLRKSLLFFGFLFAEANLVYVDLALWKYYNGKRKIRIWLIELVCTVLVVLCANVIL